MRKVLSLAVALVVFTWIGVAGITSAAVTFDAETGIGFVGKGDVQLVYGWNNKQLQDNASFVDFRVQSSEVSEVSWECTNSNNDKVQERARTTTTTLEGVFATVARVKNQVTGFNLAGYEGDEVNTTETEGPAVDSCPSGPWTLTTPAGDPTVSQTGGGFEVSTNGDDWFPL